MNTRRLAAALVLSLAACGAPPPKPPDHIAVDHILIGVRSSAFPTGKRTEAVARTFAYDLFAKLKSGADWAAAKLANSEDTQGGGGPYKMANHGVQTGPGERPRDGMVPAFGDVGFTLAVGEMGMADFDPARSPFGFHIIKRVE